MMGWTFDLPNMGYLLGLLVTICGDTDKSTKVEKSKEGSGLCDRDSESLVLRW